MHEYLNKKGPWLIKDSPSFQLKPGIILRKNGEVRLIIDTKYKILDGKERYLGISQSDIYQMFAYSHKFNCNKIILLYPWNEKITIPEKDINYKKQRF